MTFEERITPVLLALAHEALDRGWYGHVEDFANFLKALGSGRWRQLPDDEQLFWVKRLATRLGGRDSLIDLFGCEEHPAIAEGMDILLAQEKAIARRA